MEANGFNDAADFKCTPQTNSDNSSDSSHSINRYSKNLDCSPKDDWITFPPYAYSATDLSYVDNSRRATTMVPYNLLTPMNSNMQWNVMDGTPLPPNNVPIYRSSTSMPMAAGMEMTQHANSSMKLPFASYMGYSGDNMHGIMDMWNYNPYEMMNCQQNVLSGTVKKVIHLPQCSLYPPKPTDPILTRPRPPGCKTVFVGNLPEKITEEIIREVFEGCGEILKIRMNPKSFCHVKFTSEEFVDRALDFSEYTLRIENKDDQPYTGRIHIDYAKARDDAYEYKCKQRTLQREARHKQREEVPTSSLVVHYSEHEVTELTSKLKQKEGKIFQEAALILVTWLESGECNKQNKGTFYSMIQSTNSHVKRLISEKVKYKNKLKKAKTMLKNQIQSILLQFNEIEKVFNIASLPKNWDHFSKSQRKNIVLWKKQTEEIKNVHIEEVEMDVSDDEEVKDDGAAKEAPDTTSDKNDELEEDVNKLKEDNDDLRCQLEEDVNKLKEDNDDLRCQLEAAENEMIVLHSDTAQALEYKERNIQHLRQLLNMGPFNTTSFDMCISETDAYKLALISTFLHMHPFGATIDYICSYLCQIDSSLQPSDVESLMKRFPNIYIEESAVIGASSEKWKFVGFQ